MATELEPIYVEEDNNPSIESPQGSTQNEGVSIGSPMPQMSMPDDIASIRARKIQTGVGHLIPSEKNTFENIKRDIAEGRESLLRQDAANKQMYQNSLLKQRMLVELAAKKGGPLDENEVSRIMDPYSPLNRVDPDSIVEKEYAKKYVSSIQDAIDSVKSVPLQDAKKEIPEQVADAEEKATVLKQKMEYAAKVRDDVASSIKQQSWLGWGADQAKNLFQPYVEYKMRGNTADVGTISGGLLLGNNLQEQADKIFSLPFETGEFQKALKTVTDSLSKDNPSLAYKFAEYVEGLPRTDRILDNTFTLMAVPDYLTIGKVGASIARKVSLRNRTNQAMKDLVKAGDDITASKSSKSEALGDVSTAAVDRSTDNIVSTFEGKHDPVKFATEDSLTTNLNQMRDKIESNPGSLSREQVVRVKDAFDASAQTLLQKITDTVRINRIPMAVATQNAVRVIKDSIKEYYPGIRNAILDISNPIYEPKSNTFWHDITFGNIGGDLFSNPQTAQNFAKLHGLDAQIVESYGRVTPEQVQKFLDRRLQAEKNVKEAESSIATNRAILKDDKASAEAKAAAKEQVEGLIGHRERYKKEIEDIQLRLKNKETYDRVKQLEAEANQFAATNKELRAIQKKETSEEIKAHRAEAIKFGEAQIAARKQEANALKQGTAEVRGADTIEQHGVGFKIVVRRPLVETDKAVRDLLIRDASGKLIPEATSTSSDTGLKALFNGALGRFRGADDTLALNESIQRKIGTYSQSLFKEWAYQEAKYIKQIASGLVRNDPVTGERIPYWRAKPAAIINKLRGGTSKEFNEFSRTLDYARDAHDPNTGQIGYFFETPGQLDQHYLTNFDRLPTFAEHQAYFAFVRMVEGDRVLREVAEFRNRARLGVEQHSISVRGPDGKPMKSDFFDGLVKKTFPGGEDVIMVMGRKAGDEKLYNLGGSAISPAQLKEWREGVIGGKYKVIEVYAAEHTPLRNFSDIAGNEHVRYVLTDNVETKPIEFNHVNRRGGGHFEYDYEHYIKQAKMYHQYENTPEIKGRYRSVYVGDQTFMPVENRAMGGDIARKLNAVRELIKSNELEEAKRYTEAHLPIEWDELQRMFKPSRDDKSKTVPARFDLHEPFTVVPNNKLISDMGNDLKNRYGNAFKDATKSGSLNSQFKTAFNTERESLGLRTFEDIGTQGNPIYKWDPKGARMVDPMTTMNRALNRIMNSTFMDDYKIYAVEHWLREAEPWLELDKSQVRSSPFWAFEQASTKAAFQGATPQEIVNNLLANRNKIKQFTGVPNTAQTYLHSAKEMLVDWAYNSYGPKEGRSLGQKAITLIPEWMLARATDPISFIRSMTFHEKLGLFNPAQLLVQAQTYSAIWSISPFHSIPGTYAAMLHYWADINPNMVKTLDQYATKISGLGQSRWRPGEFMEAKKVLNDTGFAHVAGEYANLDTALKTDYIGNDFKNFLNAGTFFFRKGEESTRLGGWYTAFREFREANPIKTLTRDDIGSILQRADLLTINMSRASNSVLHTGVMSMTTQFLSYQIRLAELFMGKRLGETLAERNLARLRLVTFYSLLYGAPTATGLVGLPLANSIRQEAIQRGYNVGENWLTSAVMEGLPAITMAQATGNNYNIGGRYGSPGFTQLYDALKSDHAWYQLLGGAAGTSLQNTLGSANSFFHVAGSMMAPNNKDKAFPLKLDDFVDIFKEITTVNQTWKVLAAIHTGKWMSKNESYIGDVTKANAAFMATFGLNPQEQDDLFNKSEIKKSEVAMQKYYLKEFIQEYRRYMQAASDKNESAAKDYITRAHTMLEISGYPVQKMATAYSLAAKGWESRINASDYDFAFKDVPRSRSDFLGIPMPFTTQSNLPKTRYEQYKNKQLLERKNK